MARRADYFIKSLGKGFKILRAFTPERPELTLTEVADIVGFDRATARRFLYTLEDLGLLEKTARKYFRLSPKILELAHTYISSLHFPDIAMPLMEELREEFNESVNLGVLDRNEIVYVVRVPARRIIGMNIRVGTRLPAHATSMGKMILSHKPFRTVKAWLGGKLEKYTDNTITDFEKFRDELNMIKERGYAINNEELEVGLISIAVPIKDYTGEVIAAMNIATSTSRYTVDDLVKKFLPRLNEVAEKVSRQLAYKGDWKKF